MGGSFLGGTRRSRQIRRQARSPSRAILITFWARASACPSSSNCAMTVVLFQPPLGPPSPKDRAPDLTHHVTPLRQAGDPKQSEGPPLGLPDTHSGSCPRYTRGGHALGMIHARSFVRADWPFLNRPSCKNRLFSGDMDEPPRKKLHAKAERSQYAMSREKRNQLTVGGPS